MKTITTFSLVAILALLGISMSGMGGKHNEKYSNPVPTPTKNEVKMKVEEFICPLPSPKEATDYIQSAGASFMPTVCNDYNLSSSYFTEYLRAVNLGVYASDLCYMLTYEQMHTAKLYAMTMNDLMGDIDLPSLVRTQPLFDGDFHDKETVTEYVTEMIHYNYDYLCCNNRRDVAVYVLYGSWLEGMYLSLSVADATYDDKTLVKLICMHGESLASLIEEMTDYKDEHAMNGILARLGYIKGAIDDVYANGVTEEKFKKIKREVYKLRNQEVTPRTFNEPHQVALR